MRGLLMVSAVKQPGFRVIALRKFSGLSGSTKVVFETQTAEADVELSVGAAVERAGRDDVVAESIRLLIARNCAACPLPVARPPMPPSSAAILSSKTPVVGFMMRRVDVAERLQVEQSRGMLGVFENVRSGLVDGYRAGVAGGIGLMSGMQRARAESVYVIVFFWHSFLC